MRNRLAEYGPEQMPFPRPVLHGIYMLCFLSRFERGVVVPAHDIARAMELPCEQASKILQALAAAGIITAHRGRQGGYSLARALGEINVTQVYSAISEAQERESTADRCCMVAAREVCSAVRGLSRLREEFWNLLRRESMASLVGRPCSKRLLPSLQKLTLPPPAGPKNRV